MNRDCRSKFISGQQRLTNKDTILSSIPDTNEEFSFLVFYSWVRIGCFVENYAHKSDSVDGSGYAGAVQDTRIPFDKEGLFR